MSRVATDTCAPGVCCNVYEIHRESSKSFCNGDVMLDGTWSSAMTNFLSSCCGTRTTLIFNFFFHTNNQKDDCEGHGVGKSHVFSIPISISTIQHFKFPASTIRREIQSWINFHQLKVYISRIQILQKSKIEKKNNKNWNSVLFNCS